MLLYTYTKQETFPRIYEIIYIFIYIDTSTKIPLKTLQPNKEQRPRTDYVKNDGLPERSGVQQATPA